MSVGGDEEREDRSSDITLALINRGEWSLLHYTTNQRTARKGQRAVEEEEEEAAASLPNLQLLESDL